MPCSPTSKAFLKNTVGLGSPYGTTISLHDARCTIGRTAPVLLVADRVQDEPLARREADPQPPLLPPHAEPVELEARALRLDDLDRSEIVAERTDVVRAVVPVLGARAARPVVVDPHDAHRVQIDECHEALDRPRVPVVGRPVAVPGEAFGHAPLGVGRAEVAGRPDVDHHGVDVGDPSQRKRIHERRVGLDHRLGLDRLVGMDRRMHAVHLASHLDLAGGEGDDHLGGRAGVRIEHDRERPPRKRSAGLEPAKVGLGWLDELQRDQSVFIGEVPRGSERCDPGVELGRIERIEGVGRGAS